MKIHAGHRLRVITGHLAFWMLSGFVLLLIFRSTGAFRKIDLVYVAVVHFSVVPLFYLNELFLVPKFFSRCKYFLFGLFAVVSLIVFTGFSQLLFNRYADFIFPGYYFVSTFTFTDSLLVHFIYLVISTLIVLSGSWFREEENRRKIISMEKEKIQSELQMLKNQVNPHFFFNTLQSLYALALKNSGELPEMILKLSDLMRYVIYESDTPKISITKEIHFIRNYLELQQLRLTPGADLRFEVKGSDETVQILPLLLIHFVENCFKHGLKGETGNVYAHIFVEYDQQRLFFRAVNNKRKLSPDENRNPRGTGIENVRRRLELNYPGKYSLKINDLGKSFEITLQIRLI